MLLIHICTYIHTVRDRAKYSFASMVFITVLVFWNLTFLRAFCLIAHNLTSIETSTHIYPNKCITLSGSLKIINNYTPQKVLDS